MRPARPRLAVAALAALAVVASLVVGTPALADDPEPDPAPPTSVTGVELAAIDQPLVAGSTLALTGTIQYSDSTSSPLDEGSIAVAIVWADGHPDSTSTTSSVLLDHYGSATVTVTAYASEQDTTGKSSDPIDIEVDRGAAASLSFSVPPPAEPTAGDAFTVAVEAFDVNGESMGDVTDATTFSFADGASDDVVDGASITLGQTLGARTLVAQDGDAAASADLTVVAPPPPTLDAVVIDGVDGTYVTGATVTVRAHAEYSDGSTASVDESMQTVLTWSDGHAAGGGSGPDLVLNHDGSGTLVVTVGEVASDPYPLDVTPSGPTTLAWAPGGAPPASAQPGTAMQLSVQGTDAAGDSLGDVTSQLTFSLSPAVSGDAIQGSTVVLSPSSRGVRMLVATAANGTTLSASIAIRTVALEAVDATADGAPEGISADQVARFRVVTTTGFDTDEPDAATFRVRNGAGQTASGTAVSVRRGDDGTWDVTMHWVGVYSIVASVDGFGDSNQLLQQVTPASGRSATLVFDPGTLVAGEPARFTVEAFEGDGTAVDLGTGRQSATAQSIALTTDGIGTIAFDTGSRVTGSFTDTSAGAHVITLTNVPGVSGAVAVSFTVVAAAADPAHDHSIALGSRASQVVGAALDLAPFTRGVDEYGNVVTGDIDSIDSSVAGDSVAGSVITFSTVSGTRALIVHFDNGDSLPVPVNVLPDAAVALTLGLPARTTAGHPTAIGPVAVDRYGNEIEVQPGVSLSATSSVAKDSISALYDLVATSNGTRTVSATFTDARPSVATPVTLRASASITVAASSIVPSTYTLKVTAGTGVTGSTVVAGRTYTFTAVAKDRYGNAISTTNLALSTNVAGPVVSGKTIRFPKAIAKVVVTATLADPVTGLPVTKTLALVVAADKAVPSFTTTATWKAKHSTAVKVTLKAGVSGLKPTGTLRLYYGTKYVTHTVTTATPTSFTMTVPPLGAGTYAVRVAMYPPSGGTYTYSSSATKKIAVR